jgi:alpha-N-arabinofuranosidase
VHPSILALAFHSIHITVLQNRAFQLVTPGSAGATYAWAPIGSASIAVVADPQPVSAALPNSLALSIPADASGALGVGNAGYWGIKVDASWTYNASFYYRFTDAAAAQGKSLTATVGLQTASGNMLAATSATLDGSSVNWTRVDIRLTPHASAPDGNNNFTLTFDGAQARGVGVVHFAMFSLFPPTFKDRPNGMRKDVAETLAAAKPSFFRLPGGNNLVSAGCWEM